MGKGGKDNGICGLKTKPDGPNDPNKWSTSLFTDIFYDMPVCLESTFLPWCTQGLLHAELMDPQVEKDGWSWCGSGTCLYSLVFSIYACLGLMMSSCHMRSNVRFRYAIRESSINCCIGCFCVPCSTCQIIRELKARGHDPGRVFPCLCASEYNESKTFRRKYPDAPFVRSMIDREGRCTATNRTTTMSLDDSHSDNLLMAQIVPPQQQQPTTTSPSSHNSSNNSGDSDLDDIEATGNGDDVAAPAGGYDVRCDNNNNNF